MSKFSVVQMRSTSDLDKNIELADVFLKKSADMGADLVVLPEMFPMMGKRKEDKMNISENLGDGKIQNFLSEKSRKTGVWIVGGTIPIKCNNSSKTRSTCLVFDNKGNQVGRYDKIHLFDVKISEDEFYFESESTDSGSELSVINTPFGKIGLAICYDVRFPEMFRCLFNQGAEIFVLPCAFSVKTGQDHFEILMKSRAIENFCYVVAACQSGKHDNGRETYGHSMIVSPWGNILEKLPKEQGVIICDINLEKLRDIRKNIPIMNHQKMILKDFKIAKN